MGEDSGHQRRLASFQQQINTLLEAHVDRQIAQGAGEVAVESKRVLMAGGKRLRPVLMMMAYEACGGTNQEDIIPLALAFELIHTATLVHDDIYDDAVQRRGVKTIHASKGLAKGVIAGDWLFVQGFGLGGKYEAEIVELVSEYCSQIAQSEFLQLDRVMDLKTSPEDYLSIVIGKTAGPFAAGCKAAAILANCSIEQQRSMQDFGRELGIAFQLVDDLLDIRGDERMGKPRGADIYEGKMTLPLIHSLTLSHGQRRERLAYLIENFADNYFDELIELLNASDSLNYTEILINNHIERARESLLTLPQNDATQLMLWLTEFMQHREV
jgi:octaprenyl-diphosphate synthase